MNIIEEANKILDSKKRRIYIERCIPAENCSLEIGIACQNPFDTPVEIRNILVDEDAYYIEYIGR